MTEDKIVLDDKKIIEKTKLADSEDIDKYVESKIKLLNKTD